MTSLLDEAMVPLKDCGDCLPTWMPEPCQTTFWRWWKHGLDGVQLETVKVGATRYTSREALNRFIRRTTRLPNGRRLDKDAPRTGYGTGGN
jgi:hypothetical protein